MAALFLCSGNENERVCLQSAWGCVEGALSPEAGWGEGKPVWEEPAGQDSAWGGETLAYNLIFLVCLNLLFHPSSPPPLQKKEKKKRSIVLCSNITYIQVV